MTDGEGRKDKCMQDGRSWNEVRATANDRDSWQKCVEASVPRDTKWIGEEGEGY